MQLLNTLYVTIPESYLHLDNDTVRLSISSPGNGGRGLN